MEQALHKGQKIAVRIGTDALGDTIASIPTLRKISKAYDNKPLTIFTSKPFLFENHPLVFEAFLLSKSTDGYYVYRTFDHLAGKIYQMKDQKVEFRYNNTDLRQFHANSLGFTLTPDEMGMDLYIEKPRKSINSKYIILHPTYTWATRTWDQSKWQQLIDLLNGDNIPVVAVGRNSIEHGFGITKKPVMDVDIKLGENLLNNPDNDPAELRWMMDNEALAVVTMDSGILHLAGTTDVNIIQLGSSIHPKYRAPWRKGTQNYKYLYIKGSCDEFCSSNMKYNVKIHNSILGTPPQAKCLADKPSFECHPNPQKVYNLIKKSLNI